MIRYSSLIILLVLACGCGSDSAESNRIKSLAEEMGRSTIEEDYEAVIDRTFDPIVVGMGGREQAIEKTKQSMHRLKQQGFIIKTFDAGQPGELRTEGTNKFVVVPTTMVMTLPDGKSTIKSFLLGISADGGKTWEFVNGSSIDRTKKQDWLPKLPADLSFPETGDVDEFN